MTVNKYSIAKNDNIYEAFPDIVITKDNNLLVVFLECKHHNDRSYTRIMLTRSFDRGKTWKNKEAFTKPWYEIKGSWNCPRISKLKNGKIIIVVDKVEFDDESNGKNYYWIGDDMGNKFEGPYLLPATGIVPDKLIETTNGRWIVSTHNKDKYVFQKLWYSDDKGKTWSEEVIVAKKDGLNLCEGSILEVEENVLICFLRENSGLGYDCIKTISYDNGLTWSDLINTPIPACHRPVAGILNNGMCMITHRYMQGGKGWVGFWTQNIFAAFMDRNSLLAKTRNEQSSRIFPLDYDRSAISDIGYSGWIQFEDGEIHVVYYIVDDSPNGQIKGIRFCEEDVIIGGFKK